MPEIVGPVYNYHKKGTIGATSALCPEVIDAVTRGIALGMTVTDTMKSIGMSPATYYDWIRAAEKGMNAINADPYAEITSYQKIAIDLFWSVNAAQAERKASLLKRIETAAIGGEKYTETKTTMRDDGEGNLVVYEQVTQEKTMQPQWTAAAWLLERLFPGEYGRRDKVMVTDWRSEVLTMIKSGSLSYEDVVAELGDEIATELFDKVGQAKIISERSSLTIDHGDYSDRDDQGEAVELVEDED